MWLLRPAYASSTCSALLLVVHMFFCWRVFCQLLQSIVSCTVCRFNGPWMMLFWACLSSTVAMNLSVMISSGFMVYNSQLNSKSTHLLLRLSILPLVFWIKLKIFAQLCNFLRLGTKIFIGNFVNCGDAVSISSLSLCRLIISCFNLAPLS